jgi:hypothetical protein
MTIGGRAAWGAGDVDSARDWLARNVFALAVVLALPAIFFVFATVVNGLTPDGRPVIALQGDDCSPLTGEHERIACRLPTLGVLPLVLEWHWQPEPGDPRIPRDLAQVLADDVKARYAFAVPTTLLILLSAPIAIIALVGLAGRPWAGWPWAGAIAGVLAGLAGVHFQDAHPVRLLAAEHLIWSAATDDGYPYLTPETWEFAFTAIDVAAGAATAASAVILVLFAALAARARPEALTADHLKARARWFRAALGLGSVVLVLTVAATYGLFHWSSALMAPGSRAPLESLASSSALYWGVIHSLTLVMATAPTVASIRLDAADLRRAPGAEVLDEEFEKAGLTLDLRRIAVTIATIAGPALTGPALDLLKEIGG